MNVVRNCKQFKLKGEKINNNNLITYFLINLYLLMLFHIIIPIEPAPDLRLVVKMW